MAPSFTTTAEDATMAGPTDAAALRQTSNKAGDSSSVWAIVLGAAGLILGAAALGLVERRARAAK